ncbi:MAG TPA: hypothetical protein VL326_38910 [Kofleriaceae bacterium]|nr:hypothetical protein [Kofleriaceae bacterium]
MNAVRTYARLLPAEAVRRLAAARVVRFDVAAQELFGAGGRRAASLDVDEARARVVERWEGDLCGLLNAMTRGELEWIAAMVDVKRDGRAPALRERLWGHGSALERCGEDVPVGLQPSPVLLGGHLVVMAPARGPFPPPTGNGDGDAWPRRLPEAREAEPPTEEPETLDDLLAAADRAIGVRLGQRGRDKGAWGMRAARLLGVEERGGSEPDWRGDVEIKTVPVAREANGLWRIVEDPAIAMLGEGGALAKLQRTLWLARADVDGPDGDDDATIVCWYLLEWDHVIARLVRQYLHVRPKGPKGTDQRGLYLHKRFFADCGLLAALNGPSQGLGR